ncbi:MAG TPA: ECF-type sigma factor [Bryobacteraceae bacterium]|nr:ECF-type sigma factor [Bryobacteraceae bacterium]
MKKANVLDPPAIGQPDAPGAVTLLLQRWRTGDGDVEAELVSHFYPDLKRIAQVRMRTERADHTLQPTALVSEFFLQLAKQEHLTWESRSHFLAMASTAMRRILIDYARAHDAGKREGSRIRIQLDDLALPHRGSLYDAAELNELLDRLEAEEPRMAKVVDMRCFGGLTHEEIGEILGVDARTVKRDWQVARAWLFGQLRKGQVDGAG